MILTKAAADHLYETLTGADTPKDSVMRFSMEGSALRMDIDRQKPSDTVFLYERIALLVLAPEMACELESATVDLSSGENGAELILR